MKVPRLLMGYDGPRQSGAGGQGKSKRPNENRAKNKMGLGRTDESNPKTENRSSAWWKHRGIPTPGLADSPALVAAGTIRDIHGRLCGIDLHNNFDIPPLDGGRTVCRPPLGTNSGAPGIRPLSFERPSSVISIRQSEKSFSQGLDPIRPYSPLLTGLNEDSHTISGGSSIYSVSTNREARAPLVHPSPRRRPLPNLKINTNIGRIDYTDYESLVSSSLCPATPTAEQSFLWDKELISTRGVICGIDRYGNSIYDGSCNLLGSYDHDSTGSTQTATRNSISTTRTMKTTTNPSTPESIVYGERHSSKIPEPTPVMPPAPSMLEIRSQFINSLPGDDAMSAITSTTARRLEEDIISCLEGDAAYDYSLPPKARTNSIRHIRYDGENGDDSNSTPNSTNSEQQSVNNGIIESWRSAVPLTGIQIKESTMNPSRPALLRDSSYSRRRSFDDSSSNVGSSAIRTLEPQNSGLKRLGNSRRRFDKRAGYEGNEAVVPSVRTDKDEEEIRNLRAEVEAARSKTLSFQTILQRTSQRFVDAQNQNEELQRQISDLRDHQKLLYDALLVSGDPRDTSYINQAPQASARSASLEGVEVMTYKDNINDIVEENKRLQAQVKSLARELAGREEEVRVLIEEMGNQRALSKMRGATGAEIREDGRKNHTALTNKSASRMGAKLKWWRKFLLG